MSGALFPQAFAGGCAFATGGAASLRVWRHFPGLHQGAGVQPSLTPMLAGEERCGGAASRAGWVGGASRVCASTMPGAVTSFLSFLLLSLF